MKDFVHLHVHSEYSLLDGYAATRDIAARAAELGMSSIALTDHGVMYGILEFFDSARKAGIKPIIGVEAYMAPAERTNKQRRAVDGKGHYYHQLLLARNATGYRNLVKLTTRAHLEGFHYKPRIDRALLEQHAEGLVATSSCLAGEIPQHIKKKQKEQAREIAAYYRDMLGRDNFYLELQLHENTPDLEEVNDELVLIGRELGIPLVATNDTHFVRREDIETHNHILAMGYNTTVRELCTDNRNFDDSYHIMSGAEMWEKFQRYGSAALENTLRIAEMCNLDLEFGRVQLPEFQIPEGHDASSYLRVVCEEGLMQRFGGNPPPHYMERLSYELDVINQTGFPDYMLIVWDYVKFARARGIPCLPRGSAGASLVLYSLSITEVDPVENKLLFERFLSPERLEMPDIDIDFADSRRHEVIEYIADKYGHENTAQIITYGTLGAKAALRDIGRVRDVPLSEIDHVAKLIPSLPVGITIAQALERVPELRQLYESNDAMRQVLDHAQKVEGRMKSVGTHACGLVVSRSPLDELVPLQRVAKDENTVMAAYEGPTLAKVGLLKMDILGLTNLSIVAETLNYIEQTTGERINLADIPLDDARTFESLSNGETVNVFQLESAGMTRYLKELKPTRVQDLYAMVALYRPGPLEQIPVYIENKNNPEKISYLHPILKPILEDTYGVIVYQEQIMQLLQAIAGYTLGRAYVVLKAIGKKKKDLMAQEEPRFKEGCIKNGLTAEQADKLWDLIQPFAGYSFNRPHSTLYGLLSYQTAYLKVNYPAQYMAAVLTAAAGDIEEVAKSIAECQRFGVEIRRVDINNSGIGFTIEEVSAAGEQPPRHAIRFGLSAIKNVGSGPVESIITARNVGGPFSSLEDFCRRVERQTLTKRVLENLIKAGAMDCLPGTRLQKLHMLDAALHTGIEAQKAHEAGQASMFEDIFNDSAAADAPATSTIPLPTIHETPSQQREQLAWEKELLGMYVSQHPLAQALQNTDLTGITSLNDLYKELVGQSFTFLGMVTNCRRILTKKGDSMLVATFEDTQTSTELVAFPKVFEQYADLLTDDAVLRITARVDQRRDMLQLIVESCEPLDEQHTAAAALTPGGTTSPHLLQPEMDIDGMATEAHESSNGNGNGNHALPPNGRAHNTSGKQSTNGHSTPNGHTAPNEPTSQPGPQPNEHTTVSTIIQGPRRMTTLPSRKQAGGTERHQSSPASNGNGNGGGNGSGGEYRYPGHNGNGNGDEEQGSGQQLHIYLPCSDDIEADVRCMQQIADELLHCEHGNDQVQLYLPCKVGMAVLQTRHTLQLSTPLLERLEDLIGQEHVVLYVEQ